MRSRRWARKWSQDLETAGFSPLPTQVVSNEEYSPLPRTLAQERLATLLQETARANARRIGVSRRHFLATSAGMASAFLALNTVFGRYFDVDPDPSRRRPAPVSLAFGPAPARAHLELRAPE